MCVVAILRKFSYPNSNLYEYQSSKRIKVARKIEYDNYMNLKLPLIRINDFFFSNVLK